MDQGPRRRPPSDPRVAASPTAEPAGGPAPDSGSPSRRRRRAVSRPDPTSPEQQPAGNGSGAAAHDQDDRPPAGSADGSRPRSPAAGRTRADGDNRSRADDSDRTLRGLVSVRGTQVPSDLALRAREAALPTPEELSQAEEEVVLVRRYYRPPAPLPAPRRDAASAPGRRPTDRRLRRD